jgi:protein TonB
VKKIEGTVEVEILIDITGRVSKARVVRSIPALDNAAVETVKQWIFSPAIKNGRPVATVASAPVTFRIF